MKLHIRYNGSTECITTELNGSPNQTAPADAIHTTIRAAYEAAPQREVLVFVEDDRGVAIMYGISFFKDPDEPPHYSIRSLPAIPIASAMKWEDAEFSASFDTFLGNFEVA